MTSEDTNCSAGMMRPRPVRLTAGLTFNGNGSGHSYSETQMETESSTCSILGMTTRQELHIAGLFVWDYQPEYQATRSRRASSHRTMLSGPFWIWMATADSRSS